MDIILDCYNASWWITYLLIQKYRIIWVDSLIIRITGFWMSEILGCPASVKSGLGDWAGSSSSENHSCTLFQLVKRLSWVTEASDRYMMGAYLRISHGRKPNNSPVRHKQSLNLFSHHTSQEERGGKRGRYKVIDWLPRLWFVALTSTQH